MLVLGGLKGELYAFAVDFSGYLFQSDLQRRCRRSAIALADVAPAVSRLTLLSALVPRLRALEGLPPLLSGPEQARFLERAWWPAGDGSVAGLAPDGALLLEHNDGSLYRRTDAA